MSAPSHSRAHLVAVVTAIVVTVLWSSSWILIRAGLDDEGLHPLSFAGLRYGLAALVLMGVVALSPSHRQEVRSVGPRATLQLAILGTIYYTLTQGAQFVAIGQFIGEFVRKDFGQRIQADETFVVGNEEFLVVKLWNLLWPVTTPDNVTDASFRLITKVKQAERSLIRWFEMPFVNRFAVQFEEDRVVTQRKSQFVPRLRL